MRNATCTLPLPLPASVARPRAQLARNLLGFSAILSPKPLLPSSRRDLPMQAFHRHLARPALALLLAPAATPALATSLTMARASPARPRSPRIRSAGLDHLLAMAGVGLSRRLPARRCAGCCPPACVTGCLPAPACPPPASPLPGGGNRHRRVGVGLALIASPPAFRSRLASPGWMAAFALFPWARAPRRISAARPVYRRVSALATATLHRAGSGSRSTCRLRHACRLFASRRRWRGAIAGAGRIPLAPERAQWRGHPPSPLITAQATRHTRFGLSFGAGDSRDAEGSCGRMPLFRPPQARTRIPHREGKLT